MPLDAGDIAHANASFRSPLLYMTIGISVVNPFTGSDRQYDTFRTGTALHETVLKPSNVDTRDFGKTVSQVQIELDGYFLWCGVVDDDAVSSISGVPIFNGAPLLRSISSGKANST
jgi:hypothetical protein